MCILPATQFIASAYAVHFGRYGDVQRLAQQHGVFRQRLYREAAQVVAALDNSQRVQQIHRLQQRIRDLESRVAHLEGRLAQSVVLDRDKQTEFACVGQAMGVSLPELRVLLDVLRPGQAPSVASLGRWTQAAGKKSAALVAVLDEWACSRAAQAVADEIYVSRPVLMVVEPESLCWLSGRLTQRLTGAIWAEELGRLPALEQVTRDGGNCLGKGVAELNARRQAQGLFPVADQLDHFHLLREGGLGLGRAERAAQRAQTALVKAEAVLARQKRRGQSVISSSNRARACRARVAKALEVWVTRDEVWQKVKGAVQLFTPEGELNTRARAEALLAESLPQLPDTEFATAKRLLQRPEALTYLDEVQRKRAALPVPAAIRAAALRQEGLRRRPELLRGEGARAATLRGVLLVGAVVIAKAGEIGQRAVAGVRAALRSSWRASSLVECVNSVVRMQQARHRKLSQGLLDLKRLYWNCHTFRTGRRRGRSPYQLLGVVLPKGVRWWELLQWSPERLRQELSTLQKAE
jgi:hypothetical protein